MGAGFYIICGLVREDCTENGLLSQSERIEEASQLDTSSVYIRWDREGADGKMEHSR